MNTATRKILSVFILALFVFGAVWILVASDGRHAPTISAIVVPHHNLVAGQRAQLFSQLKEQIGNSANEPQTIILVSPNHFLAGQSKLQTSDQDWQLNEGSISSDKHVISRLVQNGIVSNEPNSFVGEHGIYTILKDIRRTFPQAKLVPIILKSASREQLQKLESELYKSCSKCLMIASVDFSHYQPAQLAELHDQKSIRGLQTLDTLDLLNNAEVDSGASLALLTMWARDHQTWRFNLQNHTNSDLLLNDPDLEGTSHIFGWYEAGSRIEPQKFISFVISNSRNIGIEDRSVWGTDIAIKNEGNILIAGKLTQQGIEFFGLPLENDKLLTGFKKQQVLKQFYEPYENYVISNPNGNYINIPFSTNLSFDNLSSSQIESKIKSVINLKK